MICGYIYGIACQAIAILISLTPNASNNSDGALLFISGCAFIVFNAGINHLKGK